MHSGTDKIKTLSIAAAATALLLLYYFFDARKENFFPVCPFLKLTGFYCPGCGSQRAVSALLHGQLLSAFGFNLLVPLSIPFILYGVVAEFQHVFKQVIIKNNFFYAPFFAKITAIVVISFFILRNIPVYPFTLLAPGAF